MHLLAAQGLDDLLAELPHPDAHDREFGEVLRESRDVPYGRIGVEPEEKIRAREVEERQRVRLYELRHVHEFPQFVRGGRNRDAENRVARLRGCEVMAHGADAADSRRDDGHFTEVPSFGEGLETPELGDVETGTFHLPLFVELHGDLAVSLDPCDRIDDDCIFVLCHGALLLFSRSASCRREPSGFCPEGSPGRRTVWYPHRGGIRERTHPPGPPCPRGWRASAAPEHPLPE